MKETFQYLGARPLPTTRDAIEYEFLFSHVNSNLVGKPEEKSSTRMVMIVASITGILHAIWSARDSELDIQKVLYEFAKRHLAEKFKEGTLSDKEELWLSTKSQHKASPYESSRIQMKVGEFFEVETLESPIMQNTSYIKLATSIIETRDYINAVTKDRLGDHLLSLINERDLLQLFREANTEEDFVYRMNALKNLATGFNEQLLREKVSKSITGSINLLEAYLKSFPEYDETPIKFLRSINRLRQAYPIHTDTADGVQEAHKFFQLPYPIKDYDRAWQRILLNYSDALKRIFDVLNKNSLK